MVAGAGWLLAATDRQDEAAEPVEGDDGALAPIGDVRGATTVEARALHGFEDDLARGGGTGLTTRPRATPPSPACSGSLPHPTPLCHPSHATT